MPKKHALILSPFFYPEPISTGKYNAYLAEALVQNGMDVSCYCSHPLYPDWKITPSSQQLPGTSAKRGGKYMRYASNPLIRRFTLELWYAFFCLFALLRNRRYDVIIPVFPPSLFALLLPLLKRKQTKVIGIVHDLQGVYANQSNSKIKSLIFRAIGVVEKRAFRNCDNLIYLSESMRKVACESYQLTESNTVIFYPFTTITETSMGNALADILPEEKQHVVYSGALGEKQAPEQLAKFLLAALKKSPELHAHIFSQGPNFESLKQHFTHERLHYHPLVDEINLPELLQRSTVQIIPQASGTADGSLPSKLPNIVASQTRLLCITDAGSELETLVNRYPYGKALSDWQEDKLAEACISLINQEIPFDSSQQNALLSQFKREALAQYILEQL